MFVLVWPVDGGGELVEVVTAQVAPPVVGELVGLDRKGRFALIEEHFHQRIIDVPQSLAAHSPITLTP